MSERYAVKIDDKELVFNPAGSTNHSSHHVLNSASDNIHTDQRSQRGDMDPSALCHVTIM
jgi:hypothetical protein